MNKSMNLDVNHELFTRLETDTPAWWNNLLLDEELYIDIRKDNYINVYFNGGSLLKLGWAGKYTGEIHSKYIPLENENEYSNLEISKNEILAGNINPMPLNNFEKGSIQKIKARIKRYSPTESEKGIQGKYILANNKIEQGVGFFIDSEFMFDGNRVDLVWVDLANKKIAFVELKTIGDSRLFSLPDDRKSIVKQLENYLFLIKTEKEFLLRHYEAVFQAKKNLRLLPSFVDVSSIVGFEFLDKPILLIGDCTKEWIENNSDSILQKIRHVAFGCVFQGIKTKKFSVPYKSFNNVYRVSN